MAALNPIKCSVSVEKKFNQVLCFMSIEEKFNQVLATIEQAARIQEEAPILKLGRGEVMFTSFLLERA